MFSAARAVGGCCSKNHNGYKAQSGETNSMCNIRKHSAKPFYRVFQRTWYYHRSISSMRNQIQLRFKTRLACSITCNAFGNSKPMSSIIRLREFWEPGLQRCPLHALWQQCYSVRPAKLLC